MPAATEAKLMKLMVGARPPACARARENERSAPSATDE